MEQDVVISEHEPLVVINEPDAHAELHMQQRELASYGRSIALCRLPGCHAYLTYDFIIDAGLYPWIEEFTLQAIITNCPRYNFRRY